MTDKKKSRLSMLDSLAGAGAATPPPPLMSSNRALRSARDAVDAHHVWELDPASIFDRRLKDRMEIGDVSDLQRSIETNGQAVPILVRRDPDAADRYLLVYGLRRLSAILKSEKVTKVRALVANMDEDASIRMQASENAERRDLSFLEKARFAQGLLESGFGTQSEVADALNVPKSWVSMALAVLRPLGPDLPARIGAAPGVGRPRWETLAQAVREAPELLPDLLQTASDTLNRLETRLADPNQPAPEKELSLLVFEAVEKAARKPAPPKPVAHRPVTIHGKPAGRLRRTAKGLAIDLTDKGFADWLDAEAEAVLRDLHARYRAQTED